MMFISRRALEAKAFKRSDRNNFTQIQAQEILVQFAQISPSLKLLGCYGFYVLNSALSIGILYSVKEYNKINYPPKILA